MFRSSFADAALQTLYTTLEARARGNLADFAGRRVLVEGGGYQKIWLETQPMGGVMYALRDMEAAYNNVSLFLEHQRGDGRLPGSIRCEGGVVEAQFDKLQGFCFPDPAIEMYFLRGRDEKWLERVAQGLRAFDEWLWRERDLGDGLLRSFCVYDTGEDNALRYGDAPCWWPQAEPPQGYQVVPMASMDLMSWSYACRESLSEICRIQRKYDAAEDWQRAAERVQAALVERLWDEERGACFDLTHDGRRVDVLCHNTLRCMYWHSLPQRCADRFVREHLLNPAEFDTPFPLPSVAANDPAFRNVPENNWSGQSEGLTWQRAILALDNYGYGDLVARYARRFVRGLTEAGLVFCQQYDPFTGAPSLVSTLTHQPLGPGETGPVQDAYGPTILACLAYLQRLYGITPRRGRLLFSFLGQGAYSCEADVYGSAWRMETDGRKAAVWRDGTGVWSGEPGVVVEGDGEMSGEWRVVSGE